MASSYFFTALCSKRTLRSLALPLARRSESALTIEGSRHGPRNAEHPITLSGLSDKRREICGRIEQYQSALRQLIIDLDHVDYTIRLFDPDCDMDLLRPKHFPGRIRLFRGEVQRLVLEALRTAKEPIISVEIAVEVMRGRGLDPNDPRTMRLIRRRVNTCLGTLKRKGVVRDTPKDGPYKGRKLVG